MKEQIIRRFGNKRGMTFVELLVALTLLMVIILAFTPMLLYSYNNIYKAGEISETTYNAKSDIEKGLATRNSTDLLNDFQSNFTGIGEAARINLRRIVSNVNANVKGTIETIFYGGKGSIRIVSSQTVNDDTDAKRVVILVKGINFDSVVFGDESQAYRTGSDSVGWKYHASIQVFSPINIGAAGNEDAYGDPLDSSKLAGIKVENGVQTYSTEPGVSKSEESNEYLVTIIIRGQDLTNSPVRILMNYVDENGRDHKGTGAVCTYLYIDPPTMLLTGSTASSSYYTSAGLVNGTLQVEGRNMSDISIPLAYSTKLQSVKWITNDSTTGYGPYYVLTGTNGVIMRLYRPVSVSGYTKFTDTTDSTFDTFTINDGGKTRIIYPVTWGGDAAHQFFFASEKKHSDYGVPNTDREGDNCWKTELGEDTGIGQPGVYSTQAKMYYYWNGMGTEFTYRSQNRRNISYILTEWGCALRYFGDKKEEDDFDGYQTVWNPNRSLKGGTFIGIEDSTWKYNSWNNILFTASAKDSEYKDCAISTVAVKSLGTGAINDVLYDSGSGDNAKSPSDTKYYNQTSLIVSDSVFLPSLDSMFYVGSASAKSVVTQLDNVRNATTKEQANEYKWGNARWGSLTMYVLVGDSSGIGTTIFRGSADPDSPEFDDVLYTSGNSSFFLQSLSGGSAESSVREWNTTHEIIKIANHTSGSETSHTYEIGTHSSTFVWDSDIYNNKSHENKGKTACWCGKRHYDNDDGSTTEERMQCAEYYNGAAVHVPHKCWCGANHLSKTLSNGNANPYYLGEDSNNPYHFKKCVCSEYHNPTLDEMKAATKNGIVRWNCLDYVGYGLFSGRYWIGQPGSDEKKSRFYADVLNIDEGSDGKVNTNYYYLCEDPKCGLRHQTQEEVDSANLLICQQPGCGLYHSASEDLNLLNYDVCGCVCPLCMDCGLNLEGGCTERHLPGDEEDIAALNAVVHRSSYNNGNRSYYLATELAARSGNTMNTDADEHAFFVNRTCVNGYFSDLNFTLGFSSNREYVYSNISYGYPTNSNSLAEAYQSYEKYYFLSHYGDAKHSPNYAICDNAMNITNKTNWNSIDNDYYNVWFPGECYNLIKTVSKEGVTVAVGYTVSGSTYQFINDQNGGTVSNHNSSTALGGVFNDGVLAACIDEKDTELVNLLYFKDNATMDKTYLSTTNNSTYGAGSFITYGTHARQSVRFTAVDLLVESTVATETNNTANRDYYAYYGDSTGRVFRSRVAYSTGTVSGGEDDVTFTGNTERVNYISDLSASSTVKTNAGGNMEEIKLNNGASLSSVFDEITNIVVSDATIVISGKQSGNDNYVVVGIKGTTGWTYAKIKLLSGNYTINTACIMDDVYYFAGKSGNTGSNGFFAAIPVNAFTNSTSIGIGENVVISTTFNTDCTGKVVRATGTVPEVLSMAGRGAA